MILCFTWSDDMPIGVCVMHSTWFCGENKKQIKTKSKTNEELINNVMALSRATSVFRNLATIFVFNVLFAILINFFHRSLVHSYLSPLWCFSILQTNIFCSLLVDGGFERRSKKTQHTGIVIRRLWQCLLFLYNLPRISATVFSFLAFFTSLTGWLSTLLL